MPEKWEKKTEERREAEEGRGEKRRPGPGRPQVTHTEKTKRDQTKKKTRGESERVAGACCASLRELSKQSESIYADARTHADTRTNLGLAAGRRGGGNRKG